MTPRTQSADERVPDGATRFVRRACQSVRSFLAKAARAALNALEGTKGEDAADRAAGGDGKTAETARTGDGSGHGAGGPRRSQGFLTRGPPAIGLTATVSRSHLVQVLNSIVPIRARVGKEGFVEIGNVDAVRYEPGYGLTIVCQARAHKVKTFVPEELVVKHAVLTLRPRIVTGEHGPMLGVAAKLQAFDIKYIPGVIDNVLKDKLNDALSEKLAHAGWDFSKLLNRHLKLPDGLSQPRGFTLGPTTATVEMSDGGLVMRAVMPVTFTRDQQQATPRPPDAKGKGKDGGDRAPATGP